MEGDGPTYAAQAYVLTGASLWWILSPLWPTLWAELTLTVQVLIGASLWWILSLLWPTLWAALSVTV